MTKPKEVCGEEDPGNNDNLNQMGTNLNQTCCLLFLAEEIGVKLGRLGSYDILLPCRLDAIFLI